MSITTYSSSDFDAEAHLPYRAVSKAAVFSLALALLSVLALVFWELLIVPLLGLIVGAIGLLNIRRYPRELTGSAVGLTGLVTCASILVAASSIHLYTYATEVPDGYQRISFGMLQPEPGSRSPVPQQAMDLDGCRVFVKGYMYPDGQQRDIRQFVLVPDMGTCCFGGQPKLTDMIQVTLDEPLTLDYSRRRQRLGGILRVDKKKKPISGLDGVYYQLEADYSR